MIDIHTHLGDHRRFREDERPAVTLEGLLRKMDEEGIDKAVVLPSADNPEGRRLVQVNTGDVIEAHQKCPDRIIPFCNLDPRSADNSPDADFSWILEEYKNAGCRGVGEICANLYIDDPLVKNLFFHCGKVGLPVVFHLAVQIGGLYGLVDDIGLPRLEEVLREFPTTIFFGHAMAFWAEIAAEVDEQTRGDYPQGSVSKPGRIPELLAKYPNLYGDLSAGSGYNAISRDPDYGYGFLEEFQGKLLFGTDICFLDQDLPQIRFLREAVNNGKISKQAYDKITHQNAVEILKLE